MDPLVDHSETDGEEQYSYNQIGIIKSIFVFLDTFIDSPKTDVNKKHRVLLMKS